MRPGLAVSAGTHAVLLGLGLLSLGWAETLPQPPVESIAVDLVPMAQFSSIRVGDLKSTVVDTETPSAVDTETPAELAKPTGNTEEDQIKPLPTDNPSPAPTQSSAPEPAPEPEVEPAPRPAAAEPPPPEPAPPEPEPEPAPPPQRVAIAEPEPAPAPASPPAPVVPELTAPQVEPEPAEVAPEPKMRTAALDKMRADFKAEQAEAKAAAAEKARKEAEAKAAEEKKRKAAEAKKLADAKAAEEKKQQVALAAPKSDPLKDLIDENINLEESRGATTGKGGQKTLGDADGRASTLSQSEIDSLGAAMRACFNPPIGAREEGATATLYVTFKPDGSVSGTDVRAVTGSLGSMTAQAAIRAARRCGPYALVAQRYDDLYEVEVMFDPARQ